MRISTQYLVVTLLFLSIIGRGNPSSFPYTWNSKQEVKLLSIGVITSSLGGIFHLTITPYRITDLDHLEQPSLPFFETVAMDRWSDVDKRLSDLGLFSSAGIAGITCLMSLEKEYGWSKRNLLIPAMLFETNLLVLGTTELFKSTVRRTRPYAYYALAPLDERTHRDARKSFFSGHTSLAACNTVFAAKVWCDLHPSSKWKPLIWTGALVLPAAVALERVRAGKHFPSDVIAGYAVGAIAGYWVPRWHRTQTDKTTSLQVFPILSGKTTGVQLALIF